MSADTWRTISRGIDKIEEICDKAEENLHVSNDDTYREICTMRLQHGAYYKNHQKC